MKTLTVKAFHPDRPVPMERFAKRRTIGAEPVEVPATRYYRRRIAAGDLVEVKSTPAPAPKKPRRGEEE